jgi:GNAT superfamily N-acetyltransferase
VAVDNHGEALGAVAIGDHEDVQPDLSPWVWGLVVAPDARLEGVGRRLIDQLVDYAGRKGYPQVWVATGPSAIAFYERCGFTQTDRKGDTTILVRTLDPSRATGGELSAGTAEPPSAPA